MNAPGAWRLHARLYDWHHWRSARCMHHFYRHIYKELLHDLRARDPKKPWLGLSGIVSQEGLA